MRSLIPLLGLMATTCAAQTVPPQPVGTLSLPAKTLIRDRAAFQRLIGNSGISLQWISWNKRGEVGVDYRTDLLRLHGSQLAEAPNRGTLTLDGAVTEISADSFTFVGRIDIRDTPDAGRDCHREGEMVFAITQNRKYWRLQQMEVCDGSPTMSTSISEREARDC